MSLLSDTQYTPQRIYTLLRLLEAQNGQLNFDSITTWLKPNMRDVNKRAAESDHNIRQLLGATTSLGLIESPSQNQYRLCVNVPPTLQQFADIVHDRLIGLDWDSADSIVLEAYAAVVVLTEADQQTGWLEDGAKDRAARINGAVRSESSDDEKDEGKKRFNSTKFSPWQRWMVFLGLGFPLRRGGFYPYPVQRLERELAHVRAGGGSLASLEISDFLSVIAERMPYLDDGRLFKASAEQVRFAPRERRISRVLSGALLDLHDDKRLLLTPVGDSKQTYSLTSEPHAIKSVNMISVEQGAADA
jgi:hypothetical protein